MSPYENRLIAESFRRVALIALTNPDEISRLREQLSTRPESLEADALAQKGIRHLSFYEQRFDERNFLFVYFEMDELDQEKASEVVRASDPNWWAELESLLVSHPRASRESAPWQRAEFMNVVASNTVRDRSIGKAVGYAAGLHLDQELWYRTLHQTNWPGVIDQMFRSHLQNWTTFMLEYGDELILFTHSEYQGTDKAADDALMQADPVTQRWWKHTEPCLYSLETDGASWTEMNRY
ncbi:L-rhamnose mutarotase [Coraliomargarita akajimensis]|uniref:L-rhamnose mutarotase n=1 Tax=Coraliomargarita akajimensis (strain DSM 45221 / IAM 15411 / JCM 23193 / KCTC 12865 / 04OKA010-24) TaxID=583355 RepID=D5EPH7_CORAD|nr:L-rhamnose mutarotase [Coraliomargarita akajimensis]ADE53714.1 protein of unknown function DUF718 [Coraliomargarita akajimensis DSM 45221]